MELNLNNEIDNKQGQDNELTEFMSELNSALEREQELKSNGTLYNEIFKDVELAQKYVNELQNTIDKCLNNLSYERDFFYFDYDREKKEYNLKRICCEKKIDIYKQHKIGKIVRKAIKQAGRNYARRRLTYT